MIPPSTLKNNASSKKAENKKFFDRLKKKTPKDLDEITHQLHDDAFEKIDCLTCANCCKTTGPLFLQKDIERLSSFFKLRPSQFTEKYLHIDEDGDYVLNMLPCPFLNIDNYCSVYNERPKACKEYPHTNQKKIHTIFKEINNNISICPAVYEIVETWKKVF